MSEEKGKRQDSESSRVRAAEESSAVQPTHYHSRMEAGRDARDLIDPTVKSAAEVGRLTGMPVLGEVSM